MIVLIIIIIIYLIIGYFVIKHFSEIEANGEILGALIFLWPVLVLGKMIKSVLTKVGMYHPIIGNIFAILISLAILWLFFISTICEIVNLGK